jgi:hypothetical protein
MKRVIPKLNRRKYRFEQLNRLTNLYWRDNAILRRTIQLYLDWMGVCVKNEK